jgi:hypothetical protein
LIDSQSGESSTFQIAKPAIAFCFLVVSSYLPFLGGCAGDVGIVEDFESVVQNQPQMTQKNSVGVIDGLSAEYLKNKKHR